MKTNVKFGLFAPGSITTFDGLNSFVKKVEQSQIDGIFFFDHLWPHNHPEKPALDSLVATVTVLSLSKTLYSGPVTLRITMRGAKDSISKISTINAIYKHRFVCALGAGDIKSLEEDYFVAKNELYFENRIQALRETVEMLSDELPQLWLGGSGNLVIRLAQELSLGLNLWDRNIDFIKSLPKDIRFCWSGPFSSLGTSPLNSIESLVESGAEWIMVGWPPELDQFSNIIAEIKHTLL